MGEVTLLKLERDCVADDLQRIVDRIRAGEYTPTTAFVIFQDADNGRMYHRVAGENKSTSQLMGMCAYASAHLYQRAQET